MRSTKHLNLNGTHPPRTTPKRRPVQRPPENIVAATFGDNDHTNSPESDGWNHEPVKIYINAYCKGGLAVHASVGAGYHASYTVTHVATGFRVPITWEGRDDAIAFAEAFLATGFDMASVVVTVGQGADGAPVGTMTPDTKAAIKSASQLALAVVRARGIVPLLVG